MALASFALINHRWKPATLVRSEYEVYRLLPGYLSKETFDQRMNDIEKLIRKKYPHIWLDTHLFALAICLLILAGVFAVIVHIKDIMQWYPLLILIAPAIIAYWTTWRRSTYLLRLNKFHDALQTCLKEMTSHDINSQVKWGYRRLRDDDSAQTLHLADPLGKHRVSLIIEIIQIDMEMQASCEMSELLPSYRAAADDVVLDIGPPMLPLSGHLGQTRDVWGLVASTDTAPYSLRPEVTSFSPSAYPCPTYETRPTPDAPSIPPPAYQPR